MCPVIHPIIQYISKRYGTGYLDTGNFDTKMGFRHIGYYIISDFVKLLEISTNVLECHFCVTTRVFIP